MIDITYSDSIKTMAASRGISQPLRYEISVARKRESGPKTHLYPPFFKLAATCRAPVSSMDFFKNFKPGTIPAHFSNRECR